MLVGRRFYNRGYGRAFFVFAVSIVLTGGFVFAAEKQEAPVLPRYRVFSLRHISAERGKEYLAELEIGTVSQLPGAKALLVTAEPEELLKASVILGLVDAEEYFVIKAILPGSEAKKLPSNEQIAAKVGKISIGTFSEPPSRATGAKAIIDMHNGAIVALAPAEQLERIINAVEQLKGKKGVEEPAEAELAKKEGVASREVADLEPEVRDYDEAEELFNGLLKSLAEAEEKADEEARRIAEAKVPTEPNFVEPEPRPEVVPVLEEAAVEVELEEPEEVVKLEPEKIWSYEPEAVMTGDETLELDLPEKLNIIDLLDLVGKYLNLDYMYDPAKVKGEVTLKLQGRIKVKNLYPLLENVLKFRDFVMSRKGNLVTIVPAAEVLNIDPALLRTEEDRIKLGDVTVTRVFRLQHIDTASAQNLLTGMKLGADITPIPETGTLIVTAYAFRMGRVEDLLAMVDVPGRPKRFRFRQLQYTMAETLAPKVKTLAEQLGTVSITIGAPTAKPAVKPPARGRRAPKPKPKAAAPAPAVPEVYLDADERTNRILMIGFEDQLAVVDGLIDALDVEKQDLRTLRLYEIQHVGADEVLEKLSELGIIGGVAARPAAKRRTPARSKAAKPAAAKPAPTAAGAKEPLVEEPQVIVIETTNSLLVNATGEQHAQIAMIIGYVDSETIQQAIPYEIYSLENQKPEDLGTVLEKLIQETVKDKEGKIETTVKRLEEDIVIVPDENTFSLIVYASRKNQEWIGSLIKTLDRRRPQVLIDVTLVQVTSSNKFDLDIQLATKLPEMVAGDSMDVVGAVFEPFLDGKVREAYSNPAGTDHTFQGFYSDRDIQVLLTALEQKSYGRVLSKPKILVNDGQPGTIQTVESTNVEIETTIVPDQGTAKTAIDFRAYSSGLTLTITPNISEGDLLLLEVELVRSAFQPRTDLTRPPDTIEANINTVVTVPDGKTIILGGLLTLDQSKGGSKVPLLGDIPLVGGLFRSTVNTDDEAKLYVFVKANILRPDEMQEGLPELERISDRSRVAFEKFEKEFHEYEDWPGVKPKPMDPLHVLEEE
jgi:type II secretory pathway component GspD/PulD (secretin)